MELPEDFNQRTPNAALVSTQLRLSVQQHFCTLASFCLMLLVCSSQPTGQKGFDKDVLRRSWRALGNYSHCTHT